MKLSLAVLPFITAFSVNATAANCDCNCNNETAVGHRVTDDREVLEAMKIIDTYVDDEGRVVTMREAPIGAYLDEDTGEVVVVGESPIGTYIDETTGEMLVVGSSDLPLAADE